MAKTIEENKTKITELESENLKLKQHVVSQHHRIHQLEQKETNKKIIIYNIPSLGPNENLNTVLNQIQTALSNVPLKEDDIVNIKRLSSKSNKPGPVLVEMKNENISQRLLTAAKLHQIRVSLSQNQTSISFTKSNSISNSIKDNENDNNNIIYINEYISFTEHLLYKKAKAHKQEHNFKYLWRKNGNTFLRKTDNSKTYKLTSFSDFSLIQ